MQTADRVEFQRKHKQLQEEHRRALTAGDVEALDRIQTELAKLLREAGTE